MSPGYITGEVYGLSWSRARLSTIYPVVRLHGFLERDSAQAPHDAPWVYLSRHRLSRDLHLIPCTDECLAPLLEIWYARHGAYDRHDERDDHDTKGHPGADCGALLRGHRRLHRPLPHAFGILSHESPHFGGYACRVL